jgi:hypothetical protein
MKRDQMWALAETRSCAAMKHWSYNALNAATAGALIFLLRRCAPDASLDTSLLWTLAFAGCAAGLTYMQSNR